jgi:hypothetical protein
MATAQTVRLMNFLTSASSFCGAAMMGARAMPGAFQATGLSDSALRGAIR